MAEVALLSIGASAGSAAWLARVRARCAREANLFHYEVEELAAVPAALATIALVRPKVLVVNGGEAAVQAVLAGMVAGEAFAGAAPPIAVLPTGRTNLIARDLGAGADPLAALERVVGIARGDVSPHVVRRALISLSRAGGAGGGPVFGMFAGAGGLAEAMLYCRDRLYPLGLPSRLCHTLTACAALLSIVPLPGRLLPRRPATVRLSWAGAAGIEGRFQLLMVTTLNNMLAARAPGALKMIAVERRLLPMLRAALAAWRGRLGAKAGRGVHLAGGAELSIEGEGAGVILDGRLFRGRAGEPIVLRTTEPVPFLSLAA